MTQKKNAPGQKKNLPGINPEMIKKKLAEEAAIAQRASDLMLKSQENSVISMTQKIVGKIETERTVTNVPRPASLVEFNVDSKGMVKPRVKIYHEDPDEAFKIACRIMENAKQKATKLTDAE